MSRSRASMTMIRAPPSAARSSRYRSRMWCWRCLPTGNRRARSDADTGRRSPLRPITINPMAEQHVEDLQGMSRSDLLRASPRMFDSDLLDKLSRVHPAVPPILFGPAIVFLVVEGIVRGAGGWTPLWIAGGYLFWTLTEYWLHRIVFHFEPERGIGARLHWIIHGVHHDHPNDPMRLVMPPSVSIPLASLFIFGFYAVVGSPGYLPFGAGFLS